MSSGSVSRKLRRASGRPVEGSCTRRTCLPALRTIRMPALLQSPFCPQRSHARHHEVITQMESEDGWVPLGEVGKQLANLASDFDPRTFGFASRRSGAKDKFVRNRPSKGGSMRIRTSPLPDHLRIEDRHEDRDMRKSRHALCETPDGFPRRMALARITPWIWILAAVTTQEEISGRSVARSRTRLPSLSDMSRTRPFECRFPSCDFWQVLDLNGAPRPMKMGTIVSPWRYDVAVAQAIQPDNKRRTAMCATPDGRLSFRFAVTPIILDCGGR